MRPTGDIGQTARRIRNAASSISLAVVSPVAAIVETEPAAKPLASRLIVDRSTIRGYDQCNGETLNILAHKHLSNIPAVTERIEAWPGTTSSALMGVSVAPGLLGAPFGSLSALFTLTRGTIVDA